MGKYCRLCVKTDRETYIPIVGSNPLNIKEKLKKLLNIQVVEPGRLPNTICLECVTKLNQFNEFFTMCQESQVILGLIFDRRQEAAKNDTTTSEPEFQEENYEQRTSELSQTENPEEETEPVTSKEFNAPSPPKSNKKVVKFQISCYVCKEIFSCNRKFKQHFASAHSSSELRYTCCICFKSVLKYRSITRHIEGHNTSKRFSCDICDRSFSQKITLVQHLNTHSNFKTYKCECGLTFKQNSSLFKHRKQKHSKGVVATCSDCKKTFVSNETLLQHRKSRHNLEKDINCSKCDKSFASRSALSYHISSVHQNGSSSLTCMTCKKDFKTSIVLNRHIKKFHEK